MRLCNNGDVEAGKLSNATGGSWELVYKEKMQRCQEKKSSWKLGRFLFKGAVCWTTPRGLFMEDKVTTWSMLRAAIYEQDADPQSSWPTCNFLCEKKHKVNPRGRKQKLFVRETFRTQDIPNGKRNLTFLLPRYLQRGSISISTTDLRSLRTLFVVQQSWRFYLSRHCGKVL